MTKRRRFTADFKAKVALEALRGDKTIQEIAIRYKVHPNQVSTWKRQAAWVRYFPMASTRSAWTTSRRSTASMPRSYASGQDRLPKTVRFCETDLMTGDKDSFQVQRLEVVNTGRRRRWSVAEKLRIVEESFRGHRQVSATARLHDISPSLLFSWRKAFRRDRDEVIGFAPALIVPDEEAPLGAAAAVGRMEIVTVTGQRIMVGADVDALALARVVAALEAR